MECEVCPVLKGILSFLVPLPCEGLCHPPPHTHCHELHYELQPSKLVSQSNPSFKLSLPGPCPQH